MFKANRLVQIRRSGYTQNDIGGNVETLVAVWECFADVKDRSGSSSYTNNKEQWSYDYEVTKRYNPDAKVLSNDILIYDGIRHKINSISYRNEAKKDFEVIRCTRVDNQVNGSAPTISMLPTQLVITGTGADTYTNSSLIGKFISSVTVDGIEFVKKSTSSLNDQEKEFYHNQATGNLLFSVEVGSGVQIIVHYYSL